MNVQFTSGRISQLIGDNNELIHELYNVEFDTEVKDEDNLIFDFDHRYYSFDLQPSYRNYRLKQLH